MVIAASSLAASVCDAGQLPAIKASERNPIPNCATPGRMMAYLSARNQGLDRRYLDIAEHYSRLGEQVQVRWDYAFFQMIVETGSLTFRRGNGEPGSVRPEQHNFAGLGATGNGERGESFVDIATGVKAHIQHLLMYAGDRIDDPVAERTRKVQAWGILTSWQKTLREPVRFDDLSWKWAANDRSYAASIDAVAKRFFADFCKWPEPHVAREGQRREDPLEELPDPRSISGRELARQAHERARSEGARVRSAVGAASIAAATVAASKPQATESTNASAPFNGVRSDAGGHVPTTDRSAASQQAAIAADTRPAAQTASSARAVDRADDAVRTLVSGRTVILDAAFGATVPIVFDSDGSMHGRAGILTSMLGAPTDHGQWWVAQGRLCQRWNVWLDNDTQCLKLRQAGQKIRWVRDDGKTGTARISN